MIDPRRLKRFNFLAALEGEALAQWAEKFRDEVRPRGEVIFRQGDEGERFYMIEAGQVSAHRMLGEGQEQFIGYFGPGEFFGTEAVLTGEPRLLTAEAVSQTALLYLNKGDFLELYNGQPEIKASIDTIRALRAHRRVAIFPSKREEEALVLMTKRHWLWFGWRVALLTLVIAMLIGIAIPLLGSGAPTAVALLVLLYAVGVGWLFVDWRNDSFVVSSRRVVHHEKVVGLFERIEEAPLEKIQNVTSESPSIASNLFDFGNVLIQTAAGGGRIVFDFVPNTRVIRDTIQSEMSRVVEHARQREITQMRLNIRKDLEREIGISREPPAPPADATSNVQVREKAGLLRRNIGGMSLVPPTYIRKGDQIIWRRHVLLLYRDVALPVVVFVLLLPFTLFMVFGDFPLRLPLPLALLVGVVGAAASLVWLWYKYRDWENDLYVLMPDRLIDSNRKPFWLQERVRLAGLAQVQNVTFTRQSLIENFFDYGTVEIQTAGEHGNLTFDEIPHPAEAQAEISQAIERVKEQQQQREMQARRRELLDWFAEYHRLQQQAPPAATQTPS